MTTSTTKWIKRVGITIVLGSLMWLSYIFYFKSIINDYKATQIERKLQKNFKSNPNDFNDLITFSKEIKVLENCVFTPDDFIKFQVYDTTLERTKIKGNSTIINVGQNSTDNIKGIKFLNDNKLSISTGDKNYPLKNWIINFDGKLNDPIAAQLLAYNGLGVMQIKTLKELLYKVNCSAINKDDKIITLRYAGHWGESFNYIFPLSQTVNTNAWNKLPGNFFWEHYRNSLFCDLTNW